MAEVAEIVESVNNKGLNRMRTVHEGDDETLCYNNNNNINVHNGVSSDIISNHFHESRSSPNTQTHHQQHPHEDHDNNSMNSYGDEADHSLLVDEGNDGDGRSSCASNSSERHRRLVIDVSVPPTGAIGLSRSHSQDDRDNRLNKVQRLHLQHHNPQHQHHSSQSHMTHNTTSLQQLQQQHQAFLSGMNSTGEEENNNMGMDDDYSENEMPIDDEDDSENDMEERRLTVREALMSRAFNAAAAAAAKYGSSGKSGVGGTGGTGTSRSGSEMISPSPPGAATQIGISSGNIQSLMKNPIVNGHGHRQSHHSERHSHHRSSHGGHGHGHSHGHETIIKSERKSQPSSPLTCDVKPESLATASSLNNSIGNALLNLASLGSLAALQQSIPNLMSGVNGGGSNSGNNTTTGTGSNHHHPHHHISSQSQNVTLPSNSLNAPLNLTHSNTNHPITHSNSRNSPSITNSMHLAQYISQNNNNFLSNNSQITNSLTNAAASLAGAGVSPGSMPQLILASGQIVQGIQGAQLLIPTSQGLMTQTILTIPLTQPGSPQSLFSGSSPQQQSSIGASTVSNSGQGHGGGQSRNHSSHGGHGHSCNPCSPPVAPTVPPSASPDFSGPTGALPAPLLNLAPHLVGQQMGAHIPMIQEKMGAERGLNGVRNINGRRESNTVITTNSGLSVSTLCPPKMSPCSGGGSSRDSDKCSEIDDSDQMVDGINLDEIKEFAKAFKLRRLSLGLTQTQVGQALSVTEGPAYSQSAICSALAWQLAQSQSQSQSQLSHSNRTSIPQQSMFEKLDITPKSAQKIKPVLERWMKEAEDRYKNGHHNLNEFVGMEPSKKRKRRTSFTPQALEILNTHFERNTHPSGAEITTLAHQLGYEREVIRIWFCNKRQALKNTVRMMSKGSSPM